MVGKWLDCAMSLAAFHYQSEKYRDVRPPTFGDNPHVRVVEGRREKTFQLAYASFQQSVKSFEAEESRQGFVRTIGRFFGFNKKEEATQGSERGKAIFLHPVHEEFTEHGAEESSRLSRRIPIPLRFQENFVRAVAEAGTQANVNNDQGSFDSSEAKFVIPKPSLFLEELAHLFSLLSALAMATLRNDNPLAEIPITEYVPDQPWPPVDPDNLSESVRREYDHGHTIVNWIYFCLGLSRTERQRTLYNAARPFAVLGGVSDEEVRLLMDTNGPCGKVRAFNWLDLVMQSGVDSSQSDTLPTLHGYR